VHLIGTEFRWSAPQAVLARAVADGVIGEPRYALFLLHLPLLADPAGELPDWWQRADEGGGWLGAHATHIIDQVRMTLGEIAGVSAGLAVLADRPGMTADDTYTVHLRTVGGCDVLLQSGAGAWGPPIAVTRISGTKGSAWVEGDQVLVADADGTRPLPVPDELRNAPPDPPPAELMHTAYDLMHSTGIDLDPYTRLYENFAALVRDEPLPHWPPPATFADGVANQIVVDAIRGSASGAGWVTTNM
jgi:predicted dehydrogenase